MDRGIRGTDVIATPSKYRPYGAFFYVPTFRLFDSVNKTVTIPENLYDITVDQYLQIQAIPEGDELEQVVRTICILCHMDRAEVMAMEQKDIQYIGGVIGGILDKYDDTYPCLLYTSPSPRDGLLSRMPSSA